MSKEAFLKEVALFIRSHYGLICLDTIEEERAESLLRYLADEMNLPFFTWSASKGLARADFDGPVYQTTSLSTALDHIDSSDFAGLYYFKGINRFLDDPMASEKFSALVKKHAKSEGALVVMGKDLSIPDAAKVHTASLSLPVPGRQEFVNLLKHIYRDLSEKMAVKNLLSKDDINRLINNLKGLTLLEAEKILTKAIIEDRKLDADDIQKVIEAKKVVVEREGLLEYYPVEESMARIAGLAGLKMWLEKRKSIITAPEKAANFGLTFPKGVLLLGIPGTGKSLSAKAVAMEWGLPLLRMDPSSLYSKYMGETEKNFKRAMETAEKMSPVVLWVDEIEKAFSSGGSEEDGGVSKRVLGTFLSWMQERKGDVFIVATANDVTRIPPEFLRKGRFDEIFFVDLPDASAREEIFDIHLKNRGYDPKKFDLKRMAELTPSFSGAEIEQVIVSALYTAFSAGNLLTDQVIEEEIGLTKPLAKMRAEEMTSLRAWAAERTVLAN